MKNTQLVLIVSLLSVSTLVGFQGNTTINLSRDLVRLGIASQNLSPDSPTLDARPLFQAAIDYASRRSVQVITVDPGAYYFLTPQLNDRYLVIPNLNNVTIDLQGSDLYFSRRHLMGLNLNNGNHVKLVNFTLDYLELPFTQARVTSVDPLAPALMSADGTGSGLAAGQVVRTHPDSTQTVDPLSQPIDVSGSTDVVTLVLYGTGFRKYAQDSLVWATVGNVRLKPRSAGARGTSPGIDQLAVDLPPTLRG